MSVKPFTEHPDFMIVSGLVSDAINTLARELGVHREIDIHQTSATTNRLADDLTRLMLRAIDLKATRAVAA